MDSNEWDKRYEEREFVWSIAPNRYVAEELGEAAPGRVLDLACGEGRNALWLAELGWRVTAVDFSAVAVEKGRRRAESQGLRIDWSVADALEYQPPPQHYDLVLVSYLQLPVDERRRVLATAQSALAPGGTLLWIAHDLSNLADGYAGPKTAAVLCTPQDVVADLSDLEIVKAEVVRRPVEEQGRLLGVALDNLVRAVAPTGPVASS